MEQGERIHLELGPEWGPPHVAHMVLRQMLRTRERLEIRDAAGEVWPFERATVRAFWTRRAQRVARQARGGATEAEVRALPWANGPKVRHAVLRRVLPAKAVA